METKQGKYVVAIYGGSRHGFIRQYSYDALARSIDSAGFFATHEDARVRLNVYREFHVAAPFHAVILSVASTYTCISP